MTGYRGAEGAELLELALSGGLDASGRDRFGESSLGTAIRWRFLSDGGFDAAQERLLTLLLEHGADLEAGGRLTPLGYAIGNCDFPEARWLVAHGARLDTPGQPPLQVAVDSANMKDLPSMDELLAFISFLLDKGAPIDAQDSRGETALFNAAHYDSLNDILKLLLSRGARTDLVNLSQTAPLGIARQYKATKNAETLVALKAPDYIPIYPDRSEGPACAAIQSGDLPALALLPREAFVAMSARSSTGIPCTPLHLAAEAGSAAAIEALARRGLDWNLGDQYGRSPLQYALLAGRVDVAIALLKAGADPSRRDSGGRDGFYLAGGLPGDQARKFLEQSGWAKAASALDLALMRGNVGLIRALAAAAPLTETQAQLAANFGEAEALEAIPGTVKTKQKRADYPVAISVPKAYDGKAPYGLLVSMIHAQSKNQFPRDDQRPILDRRHLIWVGFDPYNGICEIPKDLPYDTHEGYILAIVYDLLSHYAIDPRRIYLAGYSWGGRLTGEIAPKQSRIFSGGIAMAGAFITGTRNVPGLDWASTHTPMVFSAGDYDFNREEGFGGYSQLLGLGYRALFIQEPRRPHSYLSAANLDRALEFIEGSNGR